MKLRRILKKELFLIQENSNKSFFKKFGKGIKSQKFGVHLTLILEASDISFKSVCKLLNFANKNSFWAESQCKLVVFQKCTKDLRRKDFSYFIQKAVALLRFSAKRVSARMSFTTTCRRNLLCKYL